MPMIRRALVLFALIAAAGCASDNPAAGPVVGPTGHTSDLSKLSPVRVSPEWKYVLTPLTQKVVSDRLQFGKGAVFEDPIHYESYFDNTRNATWVAVYGNVTSNSDYGTVNHNGYYVTWEQPGHVTEDFLPPWRLTDVEVLDQPY
jgi:hypothetical protein